MPEVRAGGEKWKARASQARGDYLRGVERPRRSWEEATSESQEAWQSGIQEAIAQNRFATGVRRTGNAGYLEGVRSVGPQRFVEGVQRSGDAYDRGFRPFAETIRSITLPPRGRRGDPQNLERVRIIAEALNQRRQELRGTSS